MPIKRFAVIGLGTFGARVAERLTELGAEVLAIDRDPTTVALWRERVDQAVVLDATDEVAFRASGVEDADTIIVAIARDLAVSTLVTAQLGQLGARHIVARAQGALHERILRLVGAHEVLNPERQVAESLAHRLVEPELRERVALSTGQEFIELAAPPTWFGQTVSACRIEERFGVKVTALIRHVPATGLDGDTHFERLVVTTFDGTAVISEGDLVAAVGTPQQIRELQLGV